MNVRAMAAIGIPGRAAEVVYGPRGRRTRSPDDEQDTSTMTGMSLYDQVDRGRRRIRTIVVAVLVVALVGGVAAWWFLRPVVQDPGVAAAAMARAWSQDRIEDAPIGTTSATDVGERYAALVEGLEAEAPRVVVLAVAEPGEEDPLATRAELEVTWSLGDSREWSYDTVVELRRAEDELEWTVTWQPEVVHPDLAEGLRLQRRRTTPPRAEILSADGDVLVANREVVDVGIEPRRAEDVAGLVDDVTAALADVLDVEVDADDLARRVSDAAEDAFVAVVTLREDDYLQVQDLVQPLPGTVFRRRQVPLAPTRDFARYTLGTAGPVTAEMIEDQPDHYVAGDVAGRSGVQAAYDDRLFGTPGIEVVLVGDDPPEDPVLFTDEPVPGEPVTVTLDEAVQQAADAAVEGTDFATAMAVVRSSDGHVLALANSAEASFDIAREGQVPPGSTFKIVTTQALLAETDLTESTPIDCPNEVTVGGRTITNAEAQELGTVPFRTAFVNSCNTAFVQLSQQLEPGSLEAAASRFGLGRELTIGLDAYSGQVPETGDAVDLAAAAIGQGRNLVSPLAMAGAVATVANGGFPGLALVIEPAPDDHDSTPEPLPDSHAELLQGLMREVVTDGTGTVLEGTPGGEVHGKTGTAEFADDAGELRTHAWFVGYQGDLAFAVAVTDTPNAYGGDVAAPVARRFLETLAGAAS